ncbi:MAG: CDP-alcohol phosphatidyltransferase family protein [Candidatus Brocadiia bacterium]|nr:MAG: CDP-alcohol phosphatidyltransferase family protein [Candidatus Brocadiia bacterium]
MIFWLKDVNMILNLANWITITRILLIVPFVSCMLKVNDPQFGQMMRYISIAIFFIMAVSDVLDGYFARVKKQITKLGSFLDPLADKLLMTCACLLLASDRAGIPGFELPPTVVVIIISKDLFLLIGFIIVFFFTLQVRIIPARIGKIASFLHLSMVAGILLAPEISGLIPYDGWHWFLRLLWWSAAGTAVLATLIYIRIGSRYIEEYEKNQTRQQ